MTFWEWYSIVDITLTLTWAAYMLLFRRATLRRWADQLGAWL